MDIVSGLAVFFMIWWTAIFLVLPWGLKRDERGLPSDPRLKQKLLITTGVAVVLWLAIHQMILADIIDFRGFADQMMKQDYTP